ncbi:MAG: hypothetical protein QXJ62_02980 [Nitrososphaeria archaeon]
MPEIRKIYRTGRSRVISIPSKWLNYFEKEYSKKIEYVLMEIDEEIKIKPYLERGARNGE